MNPLRKIESYHVIVKYWCLDCERHFALDDTLIKRDQIEDRISCPYCRSLAVESMVWITDQEQLAELGCAGLGSDIKTTYQCPDCPDGEFNLQCDLCGGSGEVTIDDPSVTHWKNMTRAAIIQARQNKGMPLPKARYVCED